MTDNGKPTVGRITQLSDKPVPPDIKGGEVVSGDALALLYYSQGENSANKQIAELVAELEAVKAERDGFSKTCLELQDDNARLRALINGLECEGDHCMEEPVLPITRMCQTCRVKAKAEAGNADK